MLQYEGDWIEGDSSRVWVTDGRKRYRLKLSRELIDDLTPDDPPHSKVAYADAILSVAQFKLDQGFAQQGDGVTWIEMTTRDMSRIKAAK